MAISHFFKFQAVAAMSRLIFRFNDSHRSLKSNFETPEEIIKKGDNKLSPLVTTQFVLYFFKFRAKERSLSL